MPRSPIPDLARAAGLVILPVLVGLGGLDSLGSHHGDEAAYIDVAVHMRETGNYLIPVYHGQLLLDKPPLYYWLVALSFRLLGISLSAARLPALIGVGCTAALVYWFALRVYGSVRGAMYAALAMMSCIVTGWIGRMAVPDTVMTAGVFLGMAGYYWATTSAARHRSLLLASLGIGIAGMAKGHVGVAVAVLPLVVMIAFVDRHSPHALGWRDFLVPWTWLPAVVLSTWWYIYLLSSHRPVIDFAPAHPDARQTISGALVQFFSGEVQHQVTQGWLAFSNNLHKYAAGLIVWFFPWTACIVAGLFVRPRPFWMEWHAHRRVTALCLTVMASVVVLFTAVVLERSSPRYLLPITPFVGILAGRYFVRREAAHGRRRLLSAPVLVSIGLLLLYDAVFGIYLPPAVRPPLETVCAALKPRLKPDDVVLSAGLQDKWSTFAMALLGRTVESLDAHPDAARLMDRINQRLSTGTRGAAVYLLTTDQEARALQADAHTRFELLDPGIAGWWAGRRHVWEQCVLLKVRADSDGRDTVARGIGRRESLKFSAAH